MPPTKDYFGLKIMIEEVSMQVEKKDDSECPRQVSYVAIHSYI